MTLALEDQKADDARADRRLDMDAFNHLAKRYEDERKSLIEAFRAETDRLKVLVNDVAPAQAGQITDKMVNEIESSRNPTLDVSPNYAEGSQVLANELPTITR